MTHRSVVLLILDGFGYSEQSKSNAIQAAITPTFDTLWSQYPHSLLEASGEAVGLFPNQMGNSEVGHLTLGAGRTLWQDLPRISQTIATGEFTRNSAFLTAIELATTQKKSIHILGLLSPGGVHSHEEHIYALLNVLAQYPTGPVYLHVFADGRDTPPKSLFHSLQQLENVCEAGGATIASLCGRYFAMDRDQRWDRTEKVYQLLVQGSAQRIAPSAIEALTLAYQNDETDEFITPTLIDSPTVPFQPIHSGDIVFFMNFRADRARQLSHALSNPSFNQFPRPYPTPLPHLVTLTHYDDTLPANVAFPPEPVSHTVGEIFAKHGLKQLRLAETEKYAHVTFFFNGGQEPPFLGEKRILIPSPQVSHYENTPEMSAYLLTDQLIQAIESQEYDVIICNYANADIIGHSGQFSATVRAIEVLDECLARIMQIVLHHKAELLITADHGNAEYMFDEHIQQPHTAHTTSPVPCFYVGRSSRMKPSGALTDIAPTLLYLLNLPIPPEMTGASLVQFC